MKLQEMGETELLSVILAFLQLKVPVEKGRK